MATAGQDFSEYRAWLEEQGVDTSAIIEIEDDYCASFFVNTDQDHNQIASFYTGAMAHAGRLSFAQHAADAELVIISPNDPTAMRNHAQECKEQGIRYIYDPSQQAARISGDDLRHGLEGCYVLTVNEYEYRLIQEKTGLTPEQILDRVGGLLVTRGAKGSTLIVDGEEYDIPTATPEQVVEPTGAGDAYRAGLMRGIQLGLPWPVAGRMGALAATYVLEQVGTQNHSFTIDSFIARYRQAFGDDEALRELLS
jgi:adenosine kinase